MTNSYPSFEPRRNAATGRFGKRPGPKPGPRQELARAQTDEDNEVVVDLHIADPRKTKNRAHAGKLVMDTRMYTRERWKEVTRAGRTTRVPVNGSTKQIRSEKGITLEFEKQVPAVVPEIIAGWVEALRLADPSKLEDVKTIVERAIAKEKG
jgi:hypothetical protein